MQFKYKLILVTLSVFLFLVNLSQAQDISPLEGKWDLVIDQDGKKLPSWLEIRHSGFNTLVGSFVYAFGSARPIAEIKLNDGKFSFAIPPQWEPGKKYLEFEGELVGETLKGNMLYTNGKKYDWEATRAPILPYVNNPKWNDPIGLFNGENLKGWHVDGEKNQWIVESGILSSPKSGSNLISDDSFMDFKLHVEFRYPKGSNSGIYLRGRYEVQIVDSKGKEPSNILFGGVYGFLTPNEMLAKNAGDWQSFDITLIGNRLTVEANGKLIITDQIIPGITGGAINSSEGEPGPIMIQGDHGPIEFRKIEIKPLLKS